MYSTHIRRLLLASGTLVILLALGMLLPATSHTVQAQTLPPRATVAPTAAPDDESGPKPTAVVPGRITGTVIDQRTGAPVAGVSVQVGDATLTSDASGNYDRNGLAPGAYTVGLRLTDGQGTAAQGDLTLAVGAGQTTLQHLFFSSPAPAVAPEPTSAPAPLSAALPNTGVGAAGGPLWLLPVGGLLLLLGLALGRRAR